MSITPNDPADFTPGRGYYRDLAPFRYWCQKVLPLVYDDSLSYYELLCKVVDYLNKTMEDVTTLNSDVTALHAAYVELQSYVNDYFSTLDVQVEIDHKLDNMASSGSLSRLLEPFIPDLVSGWLADNIEPTTPAIDRSLTVSGAGADSKVVGDELDSIDIRLQDLEYEPIEILSLTLTPEQFERGQALDWWEYETYLNKDATAGTITDGTHTQNASSRHSGGRVNGSFTSTITVTLSVEDEGSPHHSAASDTLTRTIPMMDKVHWGVAPEAVADWDELLTDTLSGHAFAASLARAFTVTPGAGQHIFYAFPVAFGNPKFNVGGFDGGFAKVRTFRHTNASGGQTDYQVWMSDQPNLGRTDVVVTRIS